MTILISKNEGMQLHESEKRLLPIQRKENEITNL